MNKHLRKISALTASLLLVGTLAGCSNSKPGNNTPAPTEAPAAQTGSGLPIVTEPITLKYWVPIDQYAINMGMQSYNENDVYKELEKRTGIKIEFIHPAIGQEREQFNLMIASNSELPDIIETWVDTYPGGVDKGVSDGVYLKLNDYVEKYAPNFKKLRESNPEIAKQTITDEGNIWAFSAIQADKEPPWYGPIIRKDWLDELGLKEPATIDEWYTVLKAFKEQKGAEYALSIPTNGVEGAGVFNSAFDIGPGFYQKDGKVLFGPMQPGYKEFLETMNKWYTEGLIDKDFPSRDAKSIESNIVNGKTAAWSGGYGRHLTYYMNLKKDDPTFKLTATVYPAKTAGAEVNFRNTNNYNKGRHAVVTADSKYAVEAVKWFDYHYGEEGSRLFNYGVENVSHTMVNGQPQYTELITKNPDGIPYASLSWKYKLHDGPFLREWDSYLFEVKEASDAIGIWAKAGDKYVLPPYSLNADEAKKNASIMTDLNTYVSEMTLKFILGAEPISKFDDFVAQLKKMNIEEAIKLQETALARYNSR